MRKLLVFLLIFLLLAPVLSACNSTSPTISSTMLPRSMKGYELYSWELDSGWHFTLITGTNRNKTLEEITTGVNIESEDGWVRIHALGVEEIKTILSRVPAGEFVSWNGGQFVLPTEQAVIKLIPPPDEIVIEIKDYAEKLGLDFLVAIS